MEKTLPEKCHFIGIGGIGMSGLARLLLRQNIAVSGSDCSQNSVTQELTSRGAEITHSHSADNIHPAATVVFSSSIKEDNVEFQQAKKLGCELLHRSDLLQRLMATKKALAVAGTHGKTTTSALLSMVLKAGALDPSFMVGGIVSELGINAESGDGDYFVAEADESDGTFLKYAPYGAIITNLGLDHLDHYQSESVLFDSFLQFAHQVTSPKHLFWCGDDANLCQLQLPGPSYGFGECDLKLSNYSQDGWLSTFDIHFQGQHYPNIQLALPGRHNALNAAGVFGLAVLLGMSDEAIRQAFREFRGVHRRCEKKGEVSKILFLDDYAHHPTEIAATLSAIRQAISPRRLVAVYQPHRPSRMQHCLGQFGNCFQDADCIFVTDIYKAGESPISGVSQEALLDEISRSRAFDESTFKDELRPHDVVVTLGAGDITRFGEKMITTLPHRKLSVGLVRGGASAEHDISLVSASFVRESLSSDIYDVTIFDISREGEWSDKWLGKLQQCDVVFPVLHGPYGEDGTIQGLFEMLQLPYVGCSHRASAIAMDKALTKQLAVLNGVRTLPFISVKKWSSDVKKQICQELSFPIFVKALHLGSSIGVIKVTHPEELDAAVEEVFQHDTGLIVEQGIEGREIEFAVLGDHVFPPGEILTHGKVYDYENKYGPDSLQTSLDPNLSEEQIERGRSLAEKAFQAIGGEGMARIDFFLDKTGRFWLNEINPIPGLTPISLYPGLCEKHGVPAHQLMDRLIVLALQRHRQRVCFG